MKQITSRIEQIKKEGYTLSFENIFNLVFENYKKIAIYAGLLIFVFTVLFFFIAYISCVAYFGIDTITEFVKPENLKPENFSKEFLLIYSGVAILIAALISPLTAGFMKMSYCADHDQEFHIATFFEYYKLSYFIQLFMATFIITLFNNGISTALDMVGASLIGSLITLIVSFYSLLTIPLIIFGNLKAIDAIKTSVALVSKQPLIIFSLTAVCMLLTIAGIVFFLIGILFTIPFIYSLYYILYKEIIGFEEIE